MLQTLFFNNNKKIEINISPTFFDLKITLDELEKNIYLRLELSKQCGLCACD